MAITITAYRFDELSADGQQAAIAAYAKGVNFRDAQKKKNDEIVASFGFGRTQESALRPDGYSFFTAPVGMDSLRTAATRFRDSADAEIRAAWDGVFGAEAASLTKKLSVESVAIVKREFSFNAAMRAHVEYAPIHPLPTSLFESRVRKLRDGESKDVMALAVHRLALCASEMCLRESNAIRESARRPDMIAAAISAADTYYRADGTGIVP